MDKEDKDKLEEILEQQKGDTTERQNKLVGRFYLTRILDAVSIIILIATIIIVIYLFTQSLFQGFISLIVGFFFLRYIFKKRSNDFLSKFRARF